MTICNNLNSRKECGLILRMGVLLGDYSTMTLSWEYKHIQFIEFPYLTSFRGCSVTGNHSNWYCCHTRLYCSWALLSNNSEIRANQRTRLILFYELGGGNLFLKPNISVIINLIITLLIHACSPHSVYTAHHQEFRIFHVRRDREAPTMWTCAIGRHCYALSSVNFHLSMYMRLSTENICTTSISATKSLQAFLCSVYTLDTIHFHWLSLCAC